MVTEGDNVSILSLNCKSLGNKEKRRQVFHYLRQTTSSIIFLQETHSTTSSEKYWLSEWGFKILFSHGNSSSRGACILFKNNFDLEITKQFSDNNGRFIIADIKLNGKNITLVNLYATNEDDPNFFHQIFEKLKHFESETLIIGGDFNCVLDPNLDKSGGRLETGKKCRAFLLKIIEDFDLTDIWRVLNPRVKRYTWRSAKAQIQCRLDFFLISQSLNGFIHDADILPGFKTDHSLIKLSLLKGNNPRGRGFWKLNTALLKDLNYIYEIKNVIRENECEEKNLNPLVYWDFLKCQIRGKTIDYCIQKSKQRKNLQNELIKQILKLEEQLALCTTEPIKRELETKRHDLESIIEHKTKGIMLRSKARWVELGERNTRYFLNLEKRNYNAKIITMLKREDGSEIKNPDDILNEEKSFYENLYSANQPKATDAELKVANDFFLTQKQKSSLTESEIHSCEGEIREEECLNALKTMPNGKTPGTDGFPADFYKVFWIDIKKPLLNTYSYAFKNGVMSKSQRRGIISLIPKKNSILYHLKNWRPISLLNTDYKIATKCIASRLKNVIPSIICSDQTGYLKGRYIGENIRLILDSINFTEENDIPGLIFFADFEKAFDSINWNFIQKALVYFNFGKDVQRWIEIFYNDICSCVINNGHASSYFDINRGVRQGCPLSPYLFIICIELLAIAFRNDPEVKGIPISKQREQFAKISLFADDTTLLLLGKKEILKRTLHIFDLFYLCSGLKLNCSKSEILRAGSLKNSEVVFCNDRNIKWKDDSVAALGVVFTTSEDKLCKLNYEPQLQKIQNLISVWRMRDLSLIGKIVVLKSLALSKLTYLFSTLPNPSEDFFYKLRKIIENFLWNNKPPKIKYSVLINSIEMGGLKLLDPFSFCNALKISWVKRILEKTPCKWKTLIDDQLSSVGGNIIWKCNYNTKDKCLQKISNKFLRNVLEAWCLFKSVFSKTSSSMNPRDIIWNNSYMQIAGSSFFYKTWFEEGIFEVSHFLDRGGQFLTFDEFKNNFAKLQCNYLDYYSVLHAIKNAKIFSDRNSNDAVQFVVEKEKVCKAVYPFLVQRSAESPSKSISKWEAIFPNRKLNWHSIFSLSFKSTISTKLQYFQYKFLNHIVYTNTKLFKMKISETTLCSFCKYNEETLSHLFWECIFANNFWVVLNIWLKMSLGYDLTLTFYEICFGYNFNHPDCLINHIILLGKLFIFSCKLKEEKPIFQFFLHKIRQAENVEKTIAIQNGKQANHKKKWKSLSTLHLSKT